MRAINLTTEPVELDPVNGPGMLAPALESSEGANERDLEELTDRERALAAAGVITVVDDDRAPVALGDASPQQPGAPDPDAEGGE